MKLPELLAPAGNSEKLRVAMHYGADAVYLGLSEFSLRAKSGGFSETEIHKAIELTHRAGKKAYVTINIFPHNRDIGLISDHISFLTAAAPDGVIVSDLGVFELMTKHAPQIPIHISTQANITNYKSAKFWERMGAARLVLSRELTIEEISEIRAQVSLELECFVHGSICISYSGRCYISSFLANRSANEGLCTNSCRWQYTLMEEKRPGEYFPVYENQRGTYVLSSKDLCMLPHLDKLYKAGINSFKIEGRMKGINYLAGVTAVYRDAIDSLSCSDYKVEESWLQTLKMSSNRGFTTGMFMGAHPQNDYNHDDGEVYTATHALVGIVAAINPDGIGEVLLRNNLKVGDTVVVQIKNQQNSEFEVSHIKDIEGNEVISAHNEQTVIIPLPAKASVNDLIRCKINKSAI
ncbi:peptidase U32 family protein [Candidatus Magnetomonas plexicatena]|uniref:peptidase U32 family protein n=1 Tax=Candidatus Magnetomonas plexicatena TaxID=2552947 RepID=UPI001C77D5CF|nr:U32 family peptidase [Nitrospirales bacterium LBB_01]